MNVGEPYIPFVPVPENPLVVVANPAPGWGMQVERALRVLWAHEHFVSHQVVAEALKAAQDGPA